MDDKHNLITSHIDFGSKNQNQKQQQQAALGFV